MLRGLIRRTLPFMRAHTPLYGLPQLSSYQLKLRLSFSQEALNPTIQKLHEGVNSADIDSILA